MATNTIVIWRTKRHLHDKYRDFYAYAWRGCWRATGRITALAGDTYVPSEIDSSPPGLQGSAFRLAGHFVGVRWYDCGRSCAVSLAVFDLVRARRTTFVWVHDATPSSYDDYRFDAFVLSERGFLAWQDEERTADPDYGIQPGAWISAHDSHGTRILDNGQPGNPTTGKPSEFSGLQITGETVTWTKAGVPKSVALS